MKTEKYITQQKHLPKKGQQIIGNYDEKSIVVYQAFNHAIADFAVKNQRFGGAHYSFNRMTWIKPNFMWMMYRAGWATKVNQERILALRISRTGFEEILKNAVHSSFKNHIYKNHEEWKAALTAFEVRLQWDPDHTPVGEKLERKAIQLGFKGEILKRFNQEWIMEITDLTDFVKTQHQNATGDFSKLEVPVEKVLEIKDEAIVKRVDIFS